jgi:hypothetical protein
MKLQFAVDSSGEDDHRKVASPDIQLRRPFVHILTSMGNAELYGFQSQVQCVTFRYIRFPGFRPPALCLCSGERDA